MKTHKQETVNLGLRIPVELYNAAKAKAHSQDLSLSQVVRMSLQKYVKEKQSEFPF